MTIGGYFCSIEAPVCPSGQQVLICEGIISRDLLSVCWKGEFQDTLQLSLLSLSSQVLKHASDVLVMRGLSNIT